MVSISSTPYFSYLSQLQGGNNAFNTPATTVKTDTTTTDNKGASASLVSSLLGRGGYSPSVLSLLQENGSGGFDPIANILGGKSVDNGITKLYASLYSSSGAASLQTAKLNNPKVAVTTSPTQDLINSATKISIAYNQTIQQNAAQAVAESKIRTDRITSVIS